jgi:hypothetical protein
MPKDQRQESLSKLLTELKIAIQHSLSADDVMAATAAIEQTGHRVNLALEVTLWNGNEECADAAEGQEFEFTPADALFLQALHIAA